MADFKQGDVVTHKTIKEFKMVVTGNCNYEQGHLITKQNPNRYLCKYYNTFTNVWESKCFYDYELLSSE
ncbi:MAG: hypothetical protein ACLGH8_02065 [Bacteroidia bacterium]